MTNATVEQTLRTAILSFDDLQKQRESVPEWGGIVVEIRGMSGRERAAMLQSTVDDDNQVDFAKFYPRLLIHCLFDPETGERIFTESDEEALNDKSGGVLERLAQIALKLSGLSETGRDEVGKASPEANGSSTTN